MTTRPVACVAEELLGETLTLPVSDPRRTHLDECPRCRALVLSYRDFLAPSREETASYGHEEERRLDEFRQRMAGVTVSAAPAERTASRSREGSEGGSWWSQLMGPALRPVWGLVAFAIVLGGLWFAPRLGPRPEPPVLRGDSSASLVVSAPEHAPEGGVRLSWSAEHDADHYEVRFYSTELTELARHDVGDTTAVVLTDLDLPQAYHAGDLLLFRVVAMKGGDDLQTSEPGSLQKP